MSDAIPYNTDERISALTLRFEASERRHAKEVEVLVGEIKALMDRADRLDQQVRRLEDKVPE